ncbi:hypothetical protein [Rhodoglobus aureus]
MGTRFLLVATWLVPAVIVVLGINTGATIWYYMEQQMGLVPDPSTYYVAAVSGLVALVLSVIVAVGISIHVANFKTVDAEVH